MCCFGGDNLWWQSALIGVRGLKNKDLGIIRGIQGRIWVEPQLNGERLFWISCVYNQSLSGGVDDRANSSSNVPLCCVFTQLSCHHTWNLQPTARPLPAPPPATRQWPTTIRTASPTSASCPGNRITPKKYQRVQESRRSCQPTATTSRPRQQVGGSFAVYLWEIRFISLN